MLARVLAVVVCPSVCPSVTRRYCIETAAVIELIFLHTGFLDLCYDVFREIGVPAKNNGTFLIPLELCPNSGLRKFRHGTPTVGECDINSDSGRSGVDSTWRRRADGRRARHVRYGSNSTGSISCRFVVDLLYNKLYDVVQQIEPMEFEPIQPTTIADTRRGAVYIAQWSIGHEGHRSAGEMPSARADDAVIVIGPYAAL